MTGTPANSSSESRRFPWVLWALAMFSLIVAVHPHRLFDSVWLVTPPTPALLGAPAWTPRLAAFLVVAGCSKPPLVLCGLLLSAALTALIRISSRRIPLAIAGLWFSLIAILCPIEQTLVLVLTAAAILLPTMRRLRTPGRFLGACTGLAVLTASLTSQIAWPFAMLSLAIIPPVSFGEREFSRRETFVLPALWFAGLTGAVVCLPGFAKQLIRPLTAVCTPQIQSVFPSLSVQPHNLLHWILPAAFMSLLLVVTWNRCGLQAGRAAALAVLLGMSFLALGGWLNLMLSGCCLAAATKYSDLTGPVRNRLAPIICLGVAILLAGFQIQRFGTDLLVARAEDRRVDPTLWKVSGRVLLTNLEQTTDWLSDDPRPPLPLLLDDRECRGSLLKACAAACMDWKDSRRDSYIRADGTWGGYINPFRDWKPSLIVADARDLTALRHLAIDPLWKVMSIDSQRVIFGSIDDQTLRPQIRNASRLFLYLEFPGQRPPGDLNKTLMIGTRVDAREVAAVLNALRLPYAALRVLPPDQHSRTAEVRTWCYAELAHRCRSHSGQVSLLDQYRAMIGLRSISESWLTSNDTRRRIQRTIESLSLDEIGSVTADPASLEEGSATSISENVGALRRAFAAGETAAIRTLLFNMPATAERKFFEAILSAGEAGSESPAKLLETVVGAADLPAHLSHEGLFYLGCLAIEAGDSTNAVAMLRQSVESRKTGLFAPLAEFLLAQLTATE